MQERKKKRSREEIISQILEACCEGTSKTALANKAELNFANANAYLKILIKNKMVKVKKGSYITTSKGVQILEIMKKIQNALKCSGITL
jgi:predicted transcriptional regulator